MVFHFSYGRTTRESDSRENERGGWWMKEGEIDQEEKGKTRAKYMERRTTKDDI